MVEARSASTTLYVCTFWCPNGLSHLLSHPLSHLVTQAVAQPNLHPAPPLGHQMACEPVSAEHAMYLVFLHSGPSWPVFGAHQASPGARLCGNRVSWGSPVSAFGPHPGVQPPSWGGFGRFQHRPGLVPTVNLVTAPETCRGDWKKNKKKPTVP